jgi:hypothetical protein
MSASRGWELKLWVRDLQTDDAKPAVTYKRPYLVQHSTGNIITCQHKAYNDHAGMYATLAVLRRSAIQVYAVYPYAANACLMSCLQAR